MASSSSSSPATATPAAAPAPAALGEGKGIRFHIKTGGARYQCVLQDRSVYERAKAARQNSTSSVSSTGSN